MENQSPEIIEDVRRCRQVVGALAREKVLGVDCEGISLGAEGPLTLVQVGNTAGQVYLFDIFKNKNLLGQGRLGTLLESKDIVKVIQSCSNDSAALYHQFNVTLANVFDTQVANITIQEHKGRKLAPLLKLADICQEYGGKSFSSELKNEIQNEWITMTSDLWAKRPMTEDMILYAASDVTAIVPEVYENQKRYIEENNLLRKFEERVQEEIFFHIDQSLKQKRKDRVDSTIKEIIANINTKYSLISSCSIGDFDEEGDEYRALQRLHYKEAANVSPLIDKLKTELIQKHLTDLLEKLEEESDSFFLSWRSRGSIIAFERHPNKQIVKKAKVVNKKMNEIALRNICTKYNLKSSLNHVPQIERETLRSLRPSGTDDPDFPKVTLRLYWLLMEEDLQKKIDEFEEKLQSFEMAESYYKKMKFFIARRTKVPGSLKRKAQMFKNDLDRTFGRDVIPSGK